MNALFNSHVGKIMRKRFVLTLVAVILGTSLEANATSCKKQTLQEEYQNASAVIYGFVDSIAESKKAAGLAEVEFRTEKYWKMRDQEVPNKVLYDPTAFPVFDSLKPGAHYYLFLFSSKGSYRLGPCSRIASVRDAEIRNFLKRKEAYHAHQHIQ